MRVVLPSILLLATCIPSPSAQDMDCDVFDVTATLDSRDGSVSIIDDIIIKVKVTNPFPDRRIFVDGASISSLPSFIMQQRGIGDNAEMELLNPPGDVGSNVRSSNPGVPLYQTYVIKYDKSIGDMMNLRNVAFSRMTYPSIVNVEIRYIRDNNRNRQKSCPSNEIVIRYRPALYSIFLGCILGVFMMYILPIAYNKVRGGRRQFVTKAMWGIISGGLIISLTVVFFISPHSTISLPIPLSVEAEGFWGGCIVGLFSLPMADYVMELINKKQSSAPSKPETAAAEAESDESQGE